MEASDPREDITVAVQREIPLGAACSPASGDVVCTVGSECVGVPGTEACAARAGAFRAPRPVTLPLADDLLLADDEVCFSFRGPTEVVLEVRRAPGGRSNVVTALWSDAAQRIVSAGEGQVDTDYEFDSGSVDGQGVVCLKNKAVTGQTITVRVSLRDAFGGPSNPRELGENPLVTRTSIDSVGDVDCYLLEERPLRRRRCGSTSV
ncbi:MAG: hypothetical protein FJ137_14420 [Deltaproteobacteria bacterium]|nr:hypothetical protein [Deltaproteobacteria bacterium]